jgi:hypothetical protein
VEIKNLGLLVVVNAVFAFPITTGLFQFFRAIGNDINSQKKREIRWIVFISLMVFSVWFYLVSSVLFRWRL